MLGSRKSSNQCQDQCFSQQVYVLHLSYIMPITSLLCTTVPPAGTSKPQPHFVLWTFFTDHPFLTKSYQKGKMFLVETLRLFSISLITSACSHCVV